MFVKDPVTGMVKKVPITDEQKEEIKKQCEEKLKSLKDDRAKETDEARREIQKRLMEELEAKKKKPDGCLGAALKVGAAGRRAT